jgi:hypothetical protein
MWEHCKSISRLSLLVSSWNPFFGNGRMIRTNDHACKIVVEACKLVVEACELVVEACGLEITPQYCDG